MLIASKWTVSCKWTEIWELVRRIGKKSLVVKCVHQQIRVDIRPELKPVHEWHRQVTRDFATSSRREVMATLRVNRQRSRHAARDTVVAWKKRSQRGDSRVIDFGNRQSPASFVDDHHGAGGEITETLQSTCRDHRKQPDHPGRNDENGRDVFGDAADCSEWGEVGDAKEVPNQGTLAADRSPIDVNGTNATCPFPDGSTVEIGLHQGSIKPTDHKIDDEARRDRKWAEQ